MEFASELLVFNDLMDLANRGGTRVPCGLRVVAPEILDQFVQARVGYAGQVSSRVTRLAGVKRPRSSSATVAPACVSKYAAVTPVMPPPMTATSTSKSRRKGRNFGKRAVSDQ